MRPDEFEAKWQAILDQRGRPEQDEQLVAEAAGDAALREQLTGQELLVAGLETHELPPLSADFAERAVAAALNTPPEDATLTPPEAPDQTASNRWLVGLVCSAAVLLIAVAGWAWWSGQGAGGDNPAVVEQPTDEKEKSPHLLADKTSPDADKPKSADLPDEAVVAVDQPNNGNTQVAAEQYQAIYDALNTLREEQVLTRPEWVDEVATLGLQPVARSMGGAINVIRSNIPPSSKSDEAEKKPQAHRPIIDFGRLS